MRGRGDGEARRWPLSPRAGGSVHAALEWILVLSQVVVLRTLATVPLALLNDLSLPFPYINAPLQLFPHGGVLGVEAR